MRAAVTAALVSAAVAVGIEGSPGRAPQTTFVCGHILDTAIPAGTDLSRFSSGFPGTLEELHWSPQVAGAGAGQFTISVVVNGSSACSLAVDCDEVAGADIAPASCGAVEFASGAAIEVRLAAEACDTLPIGKSTTTLSVLR